MDTAQFPPGEMLDEKYRIDALISVGGMGAVYVGTHTLLRKRVAIKVLRTELMHAVGMVERFQREAVAASAIGHENIVTVTDMGTTQGGVAFLVMELLEGRSLSQAIEDDAPFPVGTACDVACEILAGIEAAHQAGIVHRDLKPENVFLATRPGRGEVVKLLDFGISGLAGAETPSTRLTVTGVVMGTPGYMSPEQARGDREITGATDIYSTGVLLYEMLTHRLPYEAENYNLLIHRLLSGDYVKPSVIRPDLPPGLEAAIHRAMALDPRARFGGAAEFAAALSPFRVGAYGNAPVVHIPHGDSGVYARPPTPPPAVAVAETVAVPGTGPVPVGRRRWPLVVGLLAIVAIAAGIGIVASHGGGGSTAAAPAPPDAPRARPADAARVVVETLPSPPDAAPAAPANVTLEFSVKPATARILVDGKAISGRSIEVPQGTRPLTVRVEADGYTPHETQIVPDRSRSVEFPPLARVRKRHEHGGDPIITDNPYK